MKKQILNVCLLAFFIFRIASVSAQIPYFIGVEAGFGMHTLRFSDSYQDAFSQLTGVSYNTLPGQGITGGIRGGIYLGENFCLYTNPYFLQKNVRVETAENGEFQFEDRNGAPFTAVGFVKWKEQYTAFHLPVLLRGKLPLGNRFGLTLSAGPCLNFLLKGKGEAAIETQNKTIPVDDYALKFGKSRTDDYNNINFGVIFAPGMVFHLDDEGLASIYAEARFDVGLRDMYTENRKNFLEDGGVDILGTRKMRSTVFTLGFEYKFDTWK